MDDATILGTGSPIRDVRILGTGAYVPERIVSNDEAGAPAGVDDAWITRKTAIRERRWAAPGQATSDLATAAARAAMQAAGITAEQLSVIAVATSTPDHPQPPTAAYVQHNLGASGTAAFDVNAVCSGTVFALSAVGSVILLRRGGHALVIGADVYSRILDPADRRTVVLFGDGAGAMVLGPGERGHTVRHVALHTFGELTGLIQVPAGGSRRPSTRPPWTPDCTTSRWRAAPCAASSSRNSPADQGVPPRGRRRARRHPPRHPPPGQRRHARRRLHPPRLPPTPACTAP